VTCIEHPEHVALFETMVAFGETRYAHPESTRV